MDSTKVVASDPLVVRLAETWPQLPLLRRLSLALSRHGASCSDDKLTAPNCLQAVSSLAGLTELCIEVDHSSLEVAFVGALSNLRSLTKLWLTLRSIEYNEAVCAALSRRLPPGLQVLGLSGTSRQVRAILEHLSPFGVDEAAVTLPELRTLDLSAHPQSSGGRIGEPSGSTGGDIPSSTVWRVLERGAPRLASICLSGALAWYPPVGDVWFAKLLRLVETGAGTSLRCLDLRRNRIREDVVARLRERLRWQLGSEFQLLWDGD